MTLEQYPTRTPLLVTASVADNAGEVFVFDATQGKEVRRFGVGGGTSVVAGRAAGRALIGCGLEVQDALYGMTTFKAPSSDRSDRICAIGGDELPIAVGTDGRQAVAYNAITGDVLDRFKEDKEGVWDHSSTRPHAPPIVAIGGYELVVRGCYNPDLRTTALFARNVQKRPKGLRSRLRQALAADAPYGYIREVPTQLSTPGGATMMAAGEGMVAVASNLHGTVKVVRRFRHDRDFRPALTLPSPSNPNTEGERQSANTWGNVGAIAVGVVGGEEVVAVSWQHRLGVYAARQEHEGYARERCLMEFVTSHGVGGSMAVTHLAIGRVCGRDSLVAGYNNGAVRAWDASNQQELWVTRPTNNPITTLTII